MNWKKADAYNEGRLNGLHDELAAVFGEAQLVAEVQRKLRLKADGMFGPRTKAAVMAAVTAKAPRIGTTDIIDRRRFATPTYNGRPYKPKQRDIKDVTAICLHQMAGDYGERIARYNTLGAHLGVTVGAQQIWLYDFDLEVIHGNGWNARTIGLEIGGHYPGIESHRRSHHNELSQELIEAVCSMIRWVVSYVEEQGGHINALVSHRQSSRNRRGDPGEAIWKSIALPMSAELGLVDGGHKDHQFKIGSGRPTCEQWDPSRVGIPY